MNIIVEDVEKLEQAIIPFLPYFKPGTLVCLKGSMGAGKTTFVRAVLSHWDFTEVSSPTFSLVQEYDSSPPVFHLDLYRCETTLESDFLDLDYYFNQTTHVCFVEWPERLPSLQYPRVTIDILKKGPATREFCLQDF